MDAFAVDLDACRTRQQRLLEWVENANLTILSRRESVQWLTGAHVRPPFAPLAAMRPDGHVTLVVPERQITESVAADEIVYYEGKWHSTMRDEQLAASSDALLSATSTKPTFIACEFEPYCPRLVFDWEPQGMMQIDTEMFRLRRQKDADELRMLRRANDANRAMYERAREIVQPGINELDLYNELQAVAVRTLGEPLTYFGQDFRSGARGGPPRNRQAEAGELCILDLGVGFRGYFSDNARTLAVGGAPTPAQRRAWEKAVAIFKLVESTVRPGVSCRELFEKADRELNQNAPWVFNHHLGHGVGLAAHEGPHLNPKWDDTFAEGDFFAVEPGLYHDELRTGVRVEQNYLVTAGGVELLTDWPLGL